MIGSSCSANAIFLSAFPEVTFSQFSYKMERPDKWKCSDISRKNSLKIFSQIFENYFIVAEYVFNSYMCWYRNSDKKLSIYFGPRSGFSTFWASLTLERLENLPKAFSRRYRFGNDRLSRDANGLCSAIMCDQFSLILSGLKLF